MTKRLKIITGTLFTAGVLIVLFSYFAGKLADKVIFQPPADTYPELEGVEMAALDGGGQIALRYTPPEKSDGLVFLHCHGNAENLCKIAWRQAFFKERGYGFCAFDYEGYGRSSGTVSEAAVERDVLRVWHYLTVEKNIPPERIVIHGFSLGTGAAAFLASKVPAAKALILEAPFTSTYGVAKMQWFPGDRFPSYRYIANVNFPILIIHGDKDRIIPFSHGKKLYEKAPSPKRFFHVPGAGHNDLIATAQENYWRCINDFLINLCN